MAFRIGAALGLLGFLTGRCAIAEEPWAVYAVKNGVTYEHRMPSGSSFYEHRATALLSATPQEVLSAIWTGIADSPPETVLKRVVLAKADNQVLVYDQIRAPMVSDRDATIAIRKIVHPDGKMIEIRFDTMNALGPPPDAKHVRIPIVRGSWNLTPTPNGGTRLIYVCYSEPGGAVPALLARGAQQNQVTLDVGRILNRLSEPH